MSIESFVIAGETRRVGMGRTYSHPADAIEVAHAGDVIEILLRPGGIAYEQVPLRIQTPNLTIRGLPGGGDVIFSGDKFDLSGVGRTSRAIIQIEPKGDGCTVEGLSMCGAHNQTGNAAGIRINGADNVTILDCNIYQNDMGAMSNPHRHADGSIAAAKRQRFLGCHLHHAANRDIDLVRAKETAVAGRSVLVMDCLIVKSDDATGNRNLVHFGFDGDFQRSGTLHLLFNRIRTPFVSPVVQPSGSNAAALIVGNELIGIRRGAGNTFLAVDRGAKLASSVIAANKISAGFRDGTRPSDTDASAEPGLPKDQLIRFEAGDCCSPPSGDPVLLPARRDDLMATLRERFGELAACSSRTAEMDDRFE